MKNYNFNKYPGIQPATRDALNGLYESGGLPQIKGKWFFVDPANSTATVGGEADSPVASIENAYDLCTSGNGDGIVLLSGGTTSAKTTSYLKQPLAWSKHGITVVGVAAPTRMGGRARVANKTVTTTAALTAIANTSISRAAGSFVTDGWEVGMQFISNVDAAAITITAVTALKITCTGTLTVGAHTSITSVNTNLMTVSGDNNSFVNVHFGNFGSNVLEVGCVEVTGNRNYFGNCHLIGAGHATPAAATGAYDLKLNAAQETTFESCTFGTDTIIRAAANGNIIYDGTCYRTRFYDCDVISYSETAGHGAVNIIDVTAMSGVDIFSGCRFINWKPNGYGALTKAVIGSTPTSGHLLFDSCSYFGYTAVGATSAVYVANSAVVASGAGGIATTI